MSHALHEGVRRVLGDDCEECVARSKDLNGLSRIDTDRLRKLAELATEIKADPYGADTPQASFGASYADRKAVETLRLAGRIVYRSGIDPDVAA